MVEDIRCRSGEEEETAEHLVFGCILFEDLRYEWREGMKGKSCGMVCKQERFKRSAKNSSSCGGDKAGELRKKGFFISSERGFYPRHDRQTSGKWIGVENGKIKR